MHVQFKIREVLIQITTDDGNDVPTIVTLAVQRPDGSQVVHLKQSMARAIASALMGAAKDLNPDEVPHARS